ncbi:MAG: hypothetical protein IKD46_08000 [Lentisphaeria bacterium]|nr:hypothetical protein [Lentisphaeria bacterium]
MGKKIIWLLQYWIILIPYALIRILPYGGIRILAKWGSAAFFLIPSCRKLVLANIRCAMPELPEPEVRRIGRESAFHLCMNLLEFIWVHGEPERIERCYDLGEETGAKLRVHVAAKVRVLFVNPHLGSWEASGVMAPYYGNIDLVAVAKPVRNPYLNKLLNESGREKCKGLRIIFSKGAIRAAISALREGSGIGLLIDQNTRVRDGGCFVNFFGLPVTSSKSPASLKRFCDANNIPAVIAYGTSIREADGKIHAKMEYLPKPFDEYENDEAVLQALMDLSEKYIRRYPEQYLWFYHRFQNIPAGIPEEVRRRYPYYAAEPPPSFYDKRAKNQ